MRLEVGGGLHDVLRTNHPANTPTGHCIGLGHTIDDDALVRKFRNKRGHRSELVLAVGEVFVDLVGDDPHLVFHSPLADGLYFLWRIHRSTWVVG